MKRNNLIAVIAAAAMLLSFTACNNNGTSSGSEGSSDITSSDSSSNTSQTAPAGASVLTADTSYDTVVAAVEGHEDMNVTFGDFMKEYKYYLAAYGITDDTQELYASTLTSRREYIVNYLINDKVMEKAFEKLGLDLTDEDNAQIDADTKEGEESIKETLKSQIKAALSEGESLTDEELNTRAEEAFNKLLSDCGLSYDDFRNWQRSIVIQQKLTDHVNKDFSLDRSEAVTQAEKLVADTKAAYEENKSTYNIDTMQAYWIPEGSRYVQHILLKFDNETVTEIMTLRADGKDSDADKLREDKIAEMNAEITEVEGKVEAGEDFSALMKEYSDDGDTSASYLIVPGTTAYMDGFAECALAIPEMGSTDTVVTDYGYHIIKYTSDAAVDDKTYEEYVDGLYLYLVEANKSKNFSEAMKEWRAEYTFDIDRETLLLAEEESTDSN